MAILLVTHEPASAQRGERIRQADGAVATAAGKLPAQDGSAPDVIESGQVVRGRISRAQEIGRYGIRLEAGQEIVVFGRVPQRTPDVRMYMSLRDPDGRRVGGVTAFGYASNMRDQATPRTRIEEGGTYTVEIEVNQSDGIGSPTGEYELEALSVNTGPEPGEAQTTGESVSVNSLLRGRIDHSGDVDRYPVALRRGEEVVVYGRVPHREPAARMYMGLRDAGGHQVGGVTAFGYDSNLRDQATPPMRIEESGTYAVEIEISQTDGFGAPTGEYEIEITVPRRTGSSAGEPSSGGSRPNGPTVHPAWVAAGGLWRGTAACVSGDQPMLLVLAQARDGRVEGIVHLGPESSPSRAAYTVRGTSDARGRLVLRPAELLRAPSRGWLPPGIEGSVSPARLSGRATESSCSTLELNRQ